MRSKWVRALVGVIVAGVLLAVGVNAPAAEAASDAPFKITDALPPRSVTQGAVILDRTFSFFTSTGQLKVAGSSDGTGQVFVDDEIELVVTHADGTSATFIRNYEFQPPSDPLDVRDAFQPGTNTVHVVLRDTFGDSASSTALYLVGDQSQLITYVAMGDSYASGEGAPPFVAGTDTTSNRCHRSMLAAAVLFANDPGVDFQDLSLTHVACSGAVTDSIFTRQNSTQPPQVNALASSPDIVSISIGGNDVGFATILEACIRHPDRCIRRNGRPSDVEATAYQKLDQLTMPSRQYGGTSKLEFVYRAVIARSSNAALIVQGYPRLFPASPVLCGTLTRGVQLWINALLLEGDRRIAATAARVGAHYVDLVPVFAGHSPCERPGAGSEWINGLNLSNRVYSFHPNIKGQNAIAAALRAEFARLNLG